MKEYIKDNKVYSAPIKLEIDDSTIYTNDDELLKQYGYIEYVKPEYKPTLEQLIEQSNQAINAITDEKILNGFKYAGAEFYLTTENQANFSNLFVAKDYLTYPQQVKTKTGFYTIDNVSQVSSFYLAGVNYIKNCLVEGWKKKAEAEQKIRKEYQ